MIFEGVTERSLPSNAAEFFAKGWQMCYFANHWSCTCAHHLFYIGVFVLVGQDVFARAFLF